MHANAQGNAVRVSYDPQDSVLLELTDDLNHILELRSTGACGNYAAELRYDGSAVARYTISGGLLQSVADADGKVLRSYVNASFGGYWPRLQTIMNESGTTIAEFSYDDQLRAVTAVSGEATVEVSYDPRPILVEPSSGGGSGGGGGEGGAPGHFSSLELDASKHGTRVVVTEQFRGPNGDTSEESSRSFDWNRRPISISTGCACGPARQLTWTPAGQLTCSRDSLGHVTLNEYDDLGRVTHTVEFTGDCNIPATLPADSREEWRSYGVRKSIAQGLDLDLDIPTAVQRNSAVSPGTLVGDAYDYNPAPESIDPAEYVCQSSPLPTGSVVCRHIASGYVQGSNGPVFARYGTFFSYDDRGRLARTYGPVDLDRPGASDVPPIEERTYWSDGENSARHGACQHE